MAKSKIQIKIRQQTRKWSLNNCLTWLKCTSKHLLINGNLMGDSTHNIKNRSWHFFGLDLHLVRKVWHLIQTKKYYLIAKQNAYVRVKFAELTFSQSNANHWFAGHPNRHKYTNETSLGSFFINLIKIRSEKISLWR